MKTRTCVVPAIAIAVLLMGCVLAPVVVGQTGRIQPLNVKTGLWQVTATGTSSGPPPITPEMQARLDQMTPEQRAKVMDAMKQAYGSGSRPHTYKNCITAKDLNGNAFAGPDQKCDWKVINSTSSELEVQGGSCVAGENSGMKAEANVKIHALDSENVKGSVHMTIVTSNGQTTKMNQDLTGKWLSPTCAGAD
jgi:Protein of unknown function (DUF3617)